MEPAFGQEALDLLGLDPLDLDIGTMVVATVLESLDDREIGVGEVHVLADEPDANRRGGRLDAGDEGLPLRQVGLVLGPVEAQQTAHVVVEAFVVQNERDLVESAGVDGADDRFGRHIAEK